MKKTTGVDSIAYIFIAALIIIGLIFLVIQWGVKDDCAEIVEFEMHGVKYTDQYVVGDLIEFSCAEEAKSHAWDFGDGSVTGVGDKETHIYPKDGTYTVKLILDGTCEYEKDIRVIYADGEGVENEAGVSEAIPKVKMPKINAPSTATFGSTITFKETSGNGKSWKWNFGDGGTSTKQNPRYKYESTGTYTVRVRINGEPERAMKKILIKPKPQPKPRSEKTEQKSNNVKKGGASGGAVKKPAPRPKVEKKVFIQDKKFLRMLNDLAKHKIEKYLDKKNGFTMTSNITVNNRQDQLSTYLTTIFLTDNCEATKVTLTTTEEGYISKIKITE